MVRRLSSIAARAARLPAGVVEQFQTEHRSNDKKARRVWRAILLFSREKLETNHRIISDFV